MDKNLKSFDKHNMEKLLKEFPQQCVNAYSINVPLPKEKNFNKICFSGMGGSAIGGDILKIFVEKKSSLPFYVHRDYELPNFADEKTLLIVTSYSGNTEETISAYNKGKKNRCIIWVLTSGGKLLNLAEKNSEPFIKIPSGFPPRCALGYLFFPCFNLLKNLKIISKDISFSFFTKMREKVKIFSERKNNLAEKIANKFYNKIPIIYSGNLFYPAILRWKTQIAENSKSFAFINVFPEMNHNEIMAWHFPKNFIDKTIPVFILSSEYNDRIKKRMEFTKKIVSKIHPEILVIETEGNTLIEKIFNLIILGDWISYYLSLLNHIDPTEIPEIELLKKFLQKRRKNEK